MPDPCPVAVEISAEYRAASAARQIELLYEFEAHFAECPICRERCEMPMEAKGDKVTRV